MVYDGSITISTKIDQSGFNKGRKSLESGLSGIGQSLKGIAAAAAVAFSATTLINFGKQAVNVASDLQEVQNVVDTAFGDMSHMVESFADTAIESFGMSELSAKRTASTYMAMSKGLGLYGEQAAQMAIDAAARTGDIASFYNMTQEEADTLLKSIWTGETETLKRIGVVMTQANLDAYALAEGYGKVTSQMSQAELVQLRFAFVMEQTSLAAGDFVKTQGSWANQTRILQERWNEFLGLLGDGLVQVLTPLLQMLNNVLSALIEIAKAINQTFFGGSLDANTDSQQSMAASADAAAASENALAEATENAAKAAQKSLASFDELNVRQQETESSAAASMPVAALTTENKKQTGKGEQQDTISPIAQKIVDVFNALRKIFNEIWNHPIVVWLRETLADAIQFANERLKELSQWFEDNKEKIQSILGKIDELTNRLWKLIEPIADAAWETFKNIITDIQNIFQSAASAALYLYDKFLDLYNAVLDFLESLGILQMWQSQMQNILTLIGNLVHSVSVWIQEGIAAIQRAFGGLLDFLTGVFSGDWEKALGGLKDIFGGFADGIKAGFNFIKNIFGNIKDFLVNTVKNAKDAVVNVAKSIWNFINDLPRKIGEGLGKALAQLVKWGADAIDWAKTAIPKLIDNIVSWFKSLPGKICSIFNSIIEWFKRLPETLLNLGKNIVTGIVNGILAAKDWVFEKISGFFGGLADGFLEGTGLKKKEAPGKMLPVEVPALATGAVIPPNAKFLAMLGDQTNGRNLEAPESLLRQIVREESGNGTDNEGIIAAINTLIQVLRNKKLIESPEKFARDYKPYFDAESRRAGHFAVGGVR